MTDALATLARLRHLATEQARRALASALRNAGAAERRHQEAAATMAQELAASGLGPAHPLAGSLAAWLPTGQASLATAASANAIEAAHAATAQHALAEFRAAERAVEHVVSERREALRRAELRREQIILDDRGGSQRKEGLLF